MDEIMSKLKGCFILKLVRVEKSREEPFPLPTSRWNRLFRENWGTVDRLFKTVLEILVYRAIPQKLSILHDNHIATESHLKQSTARLLVSIKSCIFILFNFHLNHMKWRLITVYCNEVVELCINCAVTHQKPFWNGVMILKSKDAMSYHHWWYNYSANFICHRATPKY